MYCGTVTNFEFVPVVKEMSFKRFLIWSSGDPPVRWSGAIYVILKEGIIGNNHVKLRNLDQWFRRCLKKKFMDGLTTNKDR